MIIEGKNAVNECLNAGTTIEKLYVQKGNFADQLNRIIALARKQGIKVTFADKEKI